MGGDMEAVILVKRMLSLNPNNREKCKALMCAWARNEQVKRARRKWGEWLSCLDNGVKLTEQTSHYNAVLIRPNLYSADSSKPLK